jgi:phosphinothricin acetyltransferase
MADLQIRPAQDADLPALTEIYNHYIVNTAITFDLKPFTLKERAVWFDEHADTGRHRLLVGEEAGRVIGYASTGQFRNKQAYETTAEASIYCAADVVGRGLGSALYGALFDALKGEDLNRLVAGITLPNDASVALHERFGFVQVGIFTKVGRKFGRYWDVGWYERPFGASS